MWRKFLEFLPDSSGNGFSENDIVRYLKSRDICAESSGLTDRQRLIRAVMRILAEFKLHGCYQRRRRTAKKVVLSNPFQHVLNSYEIFCRDGRGCTPGTMRCRLRHITRFLYFLESGKLQDLVALCPKHFSAFVRSLIHLKPKTLAVIVSDLRSFARFLCMEGVVPKDLSEHVPKVRIPRGARIPSVWSRKDVEAILTAVDRSSPKGKRDYAVLLLACRLGIRVSDIRKLCLENFDWNRNIVELEQVKTGVPLALPLSEEIGQAIVDYLQHGRPITDHREVFLRINAPIAPCRQWSSNSDVGKIEQYQAARRHSLRVVDHNGALNHRKLAHAAYAFEKDQANRWD